MANNRFLIFISFHFRWNEKYGLISCLQIANMNGQMKCRPEIKVLYEYGCLIFIKLPNT
ncbi:hypothetical protein evm_015628, partial [Chilo suppressalis]